MYTSAKCEDICWKLAALETVIVSQICQSQETEEENLQHIDEQEASVNPHDTRTIEEYWQLNRNTTQPIGTQLGTGRNTSRTRKMVKQPQKKEYLQENSNYRGIMLLLCQARCYVGSF
jgi:hypothetical protein